ncbi:MetQ/NlpA family ABC transporter substrate-binding protein [Rhodococcus jostii]|uniref:MetQ/NlpA family ABC transporter substrate-binding protein n=1 Tax=Rhodococcus jostii TaxID=132919 RepID=A0ABU4CTC3_RHOJO|nr:MetQ/NlpA family ABC transporter substrate-binding protein [Rhodococcus jostii]MDV6286815.1 MetQ/NlpA family ABC transporter substrate-binding protein [Rhodococcus jostii]
MSLTAAYSGDRHRVASLFTKSYESEVSGQMQRAHHRSLVNGTLVPNRRRVLAAVAVTLATVTGLVGCGSDTQVNYEPAGNDEGTLVVYVGAGDDREILEYAVENLLPDSVRVELVDAFEDSNARVAAGDGDLSYFQHIPAFEADVQQHSYDNLSIVSKVNAVPYGLYSSKWKDLKDTESWVNVGLVEDQVTGGSLPHGSQVVLPATATGFARGLYLLQSAGLVKLDRPFGGTSAVDLTITQANVLDSLRHLSLLGLSYDDYLESLYESYDAVVLNPDDAASIGLEPAKDALAIEPGPANPYAHVLVAPSRLAGDQRVLELAHVLESPQLAQFLETKYRGANIPVTTAESK